MVQRFKSLLNQSLSRGVLRVRLAAGAPAELAVTATLMESDQGAPFTEAELIEILRVVLPGQNFETASVLTGSLNVGPLGIIKLRAIKHPMRLDIYTVAGESMLAHDTAEPDPFLATPVAAPVAVVPVASPVVAPPPSFSPPPPPPPPPLVAPASVPLAAPIPAAVLASLAPEMPPPPIVAQAGIPLAAVMTPAVSSPAPAQPTPVIQEDAMFRTSPQARSKNSNVDAGPSANIDASAGFAPSMPPAVMMPAPVVIQPTAEEIVDINFGSQEKSEGSYSDGNNPIDKLLREMVQLKASDMHLTVGQPVIFRVHGEITRAGEEQISSSMMEALVLPTMPPRNRKEFGKGSDTDLAYELGGVGRFRVNVFRDRNGVGAVLRHIPSQILTAEQLGLPPAITKLCTLNKGLVLVTGPTGSGKSTTLAAMLDLINKTRKEHILTIEDPIEFVHPQQRCLVNQREVHKHTTSFARALKAALREDPDIVLIGEMRDLETIAIAIETAETGHLVFGTLHTTTAMSTVDRIIDQFPADRQAQIRTMLASSLRGVVAQTLLKRKGGGRVAAHEILISNDAVAAMIREGKIQHLANHMMTQKADGNQLLNDALFKLIQDGLVEPHDAFFKAVDKNSFLASAKTKGINIAA
jgi:pilus retraction protein PilT